jgi:hypothetical protein
MGEQDRRRTQIALIQQPQYVIAKGFGAPDVICAVPLQRSVQLTRFSLHFGQLGLPVGELNALVLLGAAQDLHIVAQRVEEGFRGLRRGFLLLLQLPRALLLRSQSSFQLRHSVLKRRDGGHRSLLRLLALLLKPSGEAP